MSTAEGFAIRRNGTCLAGIEVDCGITAFPYRGCCPTGLTCPPIYNIACCMPNTACTDTLLAAPQPRCANPTWDLFDNGGYFCCEHGLQGYNKSNTNGCQRPGETLGEGDIVLSVVRLGDVSSQTSSDVAMATPTAPAPKPNSKDAPVGAIVGGVVGGVAAIVLVGVIMWLVLRKRQRKAENLDSQTYEVGSIDTKQKYGLKESACEVDGHAFQEADGNLNQTELPTVHALAELPAAQRSTG